MSGAVNGWQSRSSALGIGERYLLRQLKAGPAGTDAFGSAHRKTVIRLCARGLIERQLPPGGGTRRTQIALTAAGAAILDQLKD